MLYLAGQYIKSMQAITTYIKQDNETIPFNPVLFNSVTFLMRTKQTINSSFILCSILQNKHYQRRSTSEWCHVFNGNSEGIKFSIIKWADCRFYSRFIGNHIKHGKPVIFGDIACQKLGDNQYFRIKQSSYVLYDFCTQLNNILQNGSYAGQSCTDMNKIWTPFFRAQLNCLIFQQLVIPRFDRLNMAEKYVKRFPNVRRMAEFCLIGSQIHETSNESCSFKHYCYKCGLISEGLFKCCCNLTTKVIKARNPWIEGKITIKWRYSDDTRSRERYTSFDSSLIHLNLKSIQKMYNYCKAYACSRSKLERFQQFMIKSFHNKQQFTDSSQSSYFLPLIRLFWILVQKDSDVQLSFDVSIRHKKSIIRLNNINKKLSNKKRLFVNADTYEPPKKKQKKETDN